MDQPPTKDKKDRLQEAVSAGVTLVPVVGSAASKLIDSYLPSGYKRRRRAWEEQVADVLSRLQTDLDKTAEQLAEIDQLLTTLLIATPIAIREPEKTEVLKQAIYKSALPDQADKTYHAIFLRFVDELTPLHLRLLAFLMKPTDFLGMDGAPLTPSVILMETFIKAAIPELSDRELLTHLLQELQARQLIPPTATSLREGKQLVDRLNQTYVTDFGRRFVHFIKDT